MNKRVVVAMSGGVDSSTAAWLLKREGYEVIGATMCFGTPNRNDIGANRCCSFSNMEDARRVALQLGVPFYVFQLQEEFQKEVIDYFCEEYRKGRTPNPCIICNERLKFGSFWKRSMELGADYIATGHYARLEVDKKSGRVSLKRGLDRRKDQSYFLFSLKQHQLQHALFPLGTFLKEDVRRMAFEAGLNIHDKPESQEVCFISERSYHFFLSEKFKDSIAPGPILDRKGNILGRHKGIPFYTTGQRRGLGLATGKPLYVIGIEPEKNAILVGEEKEVYGSRFTVNSLNWIQSQEKVNPFECRVKIRYNHPGAEAILNPKGGEALEITFKTPQKAITPGQAAVFYDRDMVLGGGWIKEVINAE